ncbi:cation:proton antiporter [uncultured Sphingomonas sp.]|uniref:cation:proton antiporter n=1 Tax=uncultured Sphingomonas sp. TaxID=158754 RepID=UPI0025E8EC10|nr:cation:proton antiporter [uncultured Sphingomonas sp.]
MTFFESLLALMLAAVAMLQVARRLSLPYPTVMAAAGVAVAAIPGAPVLLIDPATALALFIAPILVDAAFDFPVGAARRLMLPLIVYAGVAVLATAGFVAWIGWYTIGLPVAAALTLGAIVAPPDAAAATAVLTNLPVAKRVEAVLKGESLFNDATALMLFNAALAAQMSGTFDWGTGARFALAAPGGILFGIAYGLLVRRLQPHVEKTVGGTLLQFLHAFVTWIVAEHLHLSAVLAVVASAMTIAAKPGGGSSPRMRVHSYAVWTTVVFLLNVFAFLLMGEQARNILSAMSGAELVNAGWLALWVVLGVIATRLLIAFGYRGVVMWRIRHGRQMTPISPAETFLLGWSGMRGLVTLATAFALPAGFPQRDAVVLAAFAVVLATVVIQGATLNPLIRWLGIGRAKEVREEVDHARLELAQAALSRLEGEDGEAAEQLRREYQDIRDGVSGKDPDTLNRRHGLAIAAVLAQRDRLEALRHDQSISSDTYLLLQEALDWRQLTVSGDEDRRIEEN